MVKKISEEASKAFYSRKRYKKSNTEVKIVNGLPELYLFGNKIAWIKHNREIWFSLCGWNTVTTRDRLQALDICVFSRERIPHIRQGLIDRPIDFYGKIFSEKYLF